MGVRKWSVKMEQVGEKSELVTVEDEVRGGMTAVRKNEERTKWEGFGEGGEPSPRMK